MDIVSTTDLTNWNLSAYKGIEYHYNLSNDDAGKVLSRCIFSIIPVIPEIGYNNSSFVSTAQCGCIPIGKFNYELKNEKFTINVTSYDKTPFVRALEATQSYDIAELKEKSQEAISFGKNFSASKTAQMMSDAFKEFAK